MTMRSWIRRIFTPYTTSTIRRARPALESLEDRCVPATWTVMNTLDDGSVGSLRWAVGQANLNTGDDTIAFDETVFSTPQTINLAGSQLRVSDTIGTQTITGPAAGVTVNGRGLSRVFKIDSLVAASISGLTITGGDASSGGGLFNDGVLDMIDCTVSGSTASGYYAFGGGLFNAGTATLTNCTVSGNSAGGGYSYYSSGSGIFNDGTATLTNCTVSGNSADLGAGLVNSYYGTATLTNTIVAGNTGFRDIDGGFTGANNLIGGNPMLAPLGNYGGPTPTMPLLPGSPAFDAGTSGVGIPATDQRGSPRVGAVDIGAFESQGLTLTPVAGSTPQTSQIGTPFANPLAVTVTANNPIEPVNGGVVRFVADRVAGATAILSASSAVIASGQAAVIAAPNNAIGSYDVVASVIGMSPISFELTNDGPIFTSLVVNTTIDSLFTGAGLLSLREAIAFVNFDSLGISTITFDEHVFATPQTITLTGSQLELSNTTETVTITGPAAGVTVSGGGLSRVFLIDSSVVASLSGLTITGGNASSPNPFERKANFGGGLFNDAGTLALVDCTVSGNSARLRGGGIYNGYFSTTTLTNCTVSGNSARVEGGGILNEYHGRITLTNCTVSGNSANGFFTAGGGVANFFGTATLTNSTVGGNSASGLFVADGGGVFNYYGTATLTNCTVTGNRSRKGGGIFNQYGTATLTNCTVSGNSAPSGGGLYNYYYSFVRLTNTIVAGQMAGGSISGAVSGSNNLIGTGGSGGLINGVDGNIVGVADPRLAPLGYYGGPTKTMPPLPGSPALDAGTSGFGIPATDQRGLGRVGAVDIGAVERQAPSITVPGSQIAYEDVDKAITGISVSSDPQGDTPFTLVLTVGSGTLTLPTTSNLSVMGNGTGSVTLSGSVADINAALAGLVYRGTLNYAGPDMLNITASDGNRSTLAGVSIYVKSAAEQAADLQARVRGLQEAGVLNQGQANSLIVKLNLQGNNGDVGKVRAFLNEVRAYLSAGILSQAEADILMEFGSILLLSLTRR